MSIIRALALLLSIALVLAEWVEAADPAPTTPISDVELSAGAFNPSHQAITLSYRLAAPAAVTVAVWDPDGGLIRTLVRSERRSAGDHPVEWDGRDWDGQPVPDEAYMFTIETDEGAIYDPETFSGGVVGDLRDADFDGEAGTVIYRLPTPSRVLARLGLRNGPMLKTLVDWQPRVGGVITEYWSGKDEDKLIRLLGHDQFSSLITYVTLPDTTVIAYGNKQESYRDYKLGRGQGRQQKPERPRTPDPEGRLRPEGLVPPAWARAPRVSLSFPRLTSPARIPDVKDAVDVRVEVDASDREFLLLGQFEVIFYADGVFFAEAERGYLPLNWHWELSLLPPGEHVLTVNVSSFKGQVGVASRKVRVVDGKK